MTIHLGWLVPGLLLLMFPADRLLSRHVQLRSFECFRTLENSPRDRAWWWVPLLWLDPLRAWAGAMVVKAAMPPFSYDWATTQKGPYAIAVAILCAAVLLQLHTRREQGALLAPIGFVGGLVAALTPWTVSAIGLTIAITGMFALRQFHAFFAAGVAAVGFLGFVLDAGPLWLLPAVAVLGLPSIVAALSGRTLEIPTRGLGAEIKSTRQG